MVDIVPLHNSNRSWKWYLPFELYIDITWLPQYIAQTMRESLYYVYILLCIIVTLLFVIISSNTSNKSMPTISIEPAHCIVFSSHRFVKYDLPLNIFKRLTLLILLLMLEKILNSEIYYGWSIMILIKRILRIKSSKQS